jgi:hypothetical protein
MATRGTLALPAAAVAALAAGALVAALTPATVLEIENAARGRTFRAPLAPGEPFAVVYQHSIYDQPVTEEFVAEDGRIVLEAVSSPSAAVREYFGILAAGERHLRHRVLPEVVFRVAMGTPQRLRVGGAERSFLDLGDPGDRLVMRAVRRPAAATWLAPFAGACLTPPRPPLHGVETGEVAP